MFVRKEHIKILNSVGIQKEALTLAKEEAVPRAVFSKRLMELHIMGLVRREGNTIYLTDAGRHLLKAWNALKSKDVPDPWINSSALMILELADKTGFIPSNWARITETRGLTEGNALTEAGQEVLKAYRKARPLIYITPEIAEFLIGLPPGPAPYDDLIAYRDAGGYGQNVINALEATRLLRISPPTREKAIYVLTSVGRKVRNALFRIPVYDSVIIIDERIVKLLTEGKIDDSTERELEIMHLREKRETTDLGKDLITGYSEQTKEQSLTHPIHISNDEIKVLEVIDEIVSKGSPEEPTPTYSDIKRKTTEIMDLGEILHLLESKNLIERQEIRRKDVYRLTDSGKQLLNKFKKLNEDITSDAVKACTYVFSGRIPKPDWVMEAKRHGLIAHDITERGYFLVKLSSTLKRTPFLTIYDAVMLHTTPSKGAPLSKVMDKIMTEVKGTDEQLVKRYISEAESKGYIDVLPNDYVVLTSAGSLMKDVISSGNTEELIKAKISITPTAYYVLLVIRNNLNKLKKTWRKGDGRKLLAEEAAVVYNNLKGATSITLDEVMKTITALRGYGLLGRAGLTEAGEKLLELGKVLASGAQ